MIKLIVSVGDLPVDAVVTKRSGQKSYNIRDELKIYPARASTPPTIIKSAVGCRFLVSTEGSVHAVLSTSEVVWETTEREAIDFLHARRDALAK